jgi:hypothetical protein
LLGPYSSTNTNSSKSSIRFTAKGLQSLLSRIHKLEHSKRPQSCKETLLLQANSVQASAPAPVPLLLLLLQLMPTWITASTSSIYMS